MTVNDDVAKALGIAEAVMGDRADDWIDAPQPCWAGRTPYALIEEGRTEEVLAVLHEEYRAGPEDVHPGRSV
jgi:hypothetical protein